MDSEYARKRQEAEDKIAALMPGKTLEEAQRLYEEFYDEFTAMRQNPENSAQDLLNCLNRNKDILEVADLFPEMGAESWEDCRRGLEYLIRKEEL